jgi:GTP-binding protein
MGAGLGHQFLRHVSRTRVLLHIVDGALDDAPTEYYKVREELHQYGQGLDGKPEILAINKLDVPGVRDDGMNMVGKLDGGARAVHLISALTGEGVSELLDTVVETLGSLVPSTDGPADSEPEREEVLRPVAIGKTKVVRKVRGEYLVSLRAATRLAGMIKSDNWQAQAQLFQQLSRLGVMDALQEAGIRPGEKFKIGKQSWEWE